MTVTKKAVPKELIASLLADYRKPEEPLLIPKHQLAASYTMHYAVLNTIMQRIGCTMDMVEIGEMLRTSRKARPGASQEAVGDALGMSRTTISRIENGTIPEIGIRKVMALCESLGLELLVRPRHARPTLQQLQAERNDHA